MNTVTPDPKLLVDVCPDCETPYTFRRDVHGTLIRELCKVCIPEKIGLPDSGARTEFKTGAVRDAMSGKGLPSMIPPCAIRRLAKLYEDGCAKYGKHNWMQGIPLSRYQDAIMRHTLQAAEGLTDQDHVASILWNAAGWMWTLEEIEAGRLPKELNDLPYYAQPH